MNKFWLVLFAVLAAGQSLAGVLVLDVSGQAQTDGRVPITTLMSIADGTHIILAEKAKLTAVDLVTGKEYVLSGARKFRIAAGTVNTDDGRPVAANALPVKNLPEIKLGAGKASQASIVMRSVVETSSVTMFPSATAVSNTTPVFQWQGQAGAHQYKVTVINEEGAMHWEALTPALALQVPPNKALQPDQEYAWKVEAIAQGDVMAEKCTWFYVPDAESLEKLRQLHADSSSSPSRQILYATMLSHSGATQEASSLWKSFNVESKVEDSVFKQLSDQKSAVGLSETALKYVQRSRRGGLPKCAVTR